MIPDDPATRSPDPTHVFREYDVRGVADRDLGDGLVERIGRAFGATIAEGTAARPRITVGRDCRLSSPRLFERLVAGLVGAGVEVLDVGVGPTPLLYFAAHHLDADAGVMITGSHNPAEDNGFKLLRRSGPFFGADLQELARRAASDGDARGGGSVQTVPVDDAYVERLVQGLALPRDLRVVVDAGNGAAGPLGARALRAAGLEPELLHCEMDGSFPHHHPDPTVPENLRELVARVRALDAHVGIAWDGDGDRLGVVDADGSVVWGDRLLALFARDVLTQHPGAAVIGEVKCSTHAFADIARHGGRPILWKTGHSLIKKKMREESALLAGEMSGHFFFADRYLGFDDGIYAALRLCERLGRGPRTVGEQLRDLPAGVSTPELRVPCDDASKRDVVSEATRLLAGEGELLEIDGVRVTWPDGAWALVRASNTGPILVLRCEAPSPARLDEIRARVESVVDRARHAVERSPT
ncbi:MAG: phosphomannomutase/phosphoglucomutase [Polyangiaceae bacterium]|nr:phosphomannomutase/phosphoglucomutase [Polyangiaceae bacterium]